MGFTNLYHKSTSGEHFEAMALNRLLPLYPFLVKDLEAFAGQLQGRAVLELGCGPGFMLEQLLLKEPGTLVGVDISQDMLARAKNRATGASLVNAEVANLPFKSGEFEVVFSRGSVFFWKNLEGAFKEIQRVTRVGASIMIGGGYGLSTPQELILEMKAKGANSGSTSEIPRLNPEKLLKLVKNLGDEGEILSKKGSGFWLAWRRKA